MKRLPKNLKNKLNLTILESNKPINKLNFKHLPSIDSSDKTSFKRNTIKLSIADSYLRAPIKANGNIPYIPSQITSTNGTNNIGLNLNNKNITNNELTNLPLPNSLSDVDARIWYLEQETRIPSLIDKTLSLEQQAKQAFNLRNKFRTQAREFMSNRILAEELMRTNPNSTWEQIIKKYTERGFSGDKLYKEILNASQRSRQSVNDILGITLK